MIWFLNGFAAYIYQQGEYASARLAQSVERKALNLVVVGSSPTVGVLEIDKRNRCQDPAGQRKARHFFRELCDLQKLMAMKSGEVAPLTRPALARCH